MEVTQKNFKEAFEQIKDHLNEAEFISFDTELSGLGKRYGARHNDLDTPEERYCKARMKIMEYGTIQIGISIFRFCQKQKRYHSCTYCFFLSGKNSGSYRYDASSMRFLAENGFDFNKLFSEGLPFLSLLEEKEIREKRAKRDLDDSAPPRVNVKDMKLKNFLTNARMKIEEAKVKKKPAIFHFSSLTSIHRKLLFANLAAEYPSCIFANNRKQDIEVTHFPSEEEKIKMEKTIWEEELNEQVGFTHVVKAILESDKPLVGHNMFLDVLHLVDKFIAPLPETLLEFKALVKANLVSFYDTKLLARDPPFSNDIVNTALGNLYEELTQKYSPPEIAVEDGCSSYRISDIGQAHNGGYDAFITGVCFLTMLKTIEGRNWGMQALPTKSKLLAVYSNKINFMGSLDMSYFDINKPEVLPDRSFILSVDCPSTWTARDARHLVGRLKSYKLSWTSDVHLYVIPHDTRDISQIKTILKGLKAASPPNVHVTLYSDKNSHRDSIEGCASKRKSKSDSLTESPPTLAIDFGKNLKRLRSTGEQLSNMALESPISGDQVSILDHNEECSSSVNVLRDRFKHLDLNPRSGPKEADGNLNLELGSFINKVERLQKVLSIQQELYIGKVLPLTKYILREINALCTEASHIIGGIKNQVS